MANESAPREHLEPGGTLGCFLRRKRDLGGVSLREIAETTKVPIRVLEALEGDDFDALPPRAFVVGFLRAYARCINIDPQEVIHLYNRGVSGAKEVPVEPGPGEVLEDDHALKRLVFLFVVGLFAASFFYVVFLRDWSPRVQKADTTTSTSLGVRSRSGERGLQQAPGGVVARKAAREDENTPSPDPRHIGRPLALEVAAVEETWLRVELDDGQSSAMLLRQGERRQWQARERFVLTIGNVTGTRLFLDGRPVELPSPRSNALHNFVLSRRRASVALP